MIKLIFTIFVLLNTQFAFATVRSFDGTDDEIDMGAVNDITTESVTECIWTKLTEDASADVLIGKKNDLTFDTAGYMLYQTSADLVRYQACSTDAGIPCVESSATTDVDGAWAFACGTYAADTSNTTTLVINGVQEDTDQNTSVGASLTNALEFAIGEDGSEGSDMNGLAAYAIHESSVLSLVMINELMWRPYLADLAGVWLMNGGNSPEPDISGSDNDGTVSNATTNSDGPPVMVGDIAL